MRPLRSFLLGLMLIATTIMPVAARQATPAASPEASPVAGGAGWRVTKDRALKLDGQASSLSPDGKWIAGPGPKGVFCVWATTGTGTCQGTDLAIRPETITWAPDSSAVAFSLNAVQYLIDSDIYVFEVNAQKLHDLTDDGVVKGNLLDTDKLTKPLEIDDVPVWSPDGKELAFVRTSWGKESHSTELMRIERDGGKPTLIRTIDKEGAFSVYEPMHWLQNDRLLFTIALTDIKSLRNGIWQIGLDGKGLKLVLAGDAKAQIPAPWLADIMPDEKFASIYSPLVLGQYAGKQQAFFLVDLEHFEAMPVKTRQGRVIAAPVFSPDGRTLLYLTSGGGAIRLVAQDLATGKETVLITNLNEGANPQHVGASTGLSWANDNTVLIQTTDGARLLMLAEAE